MLQSIKPRWVGYRKNWDVNMLDGMLQYMAMERLTSRHSITREDVACDTAKDVVIYINRETVDNNFANNRPISVVILNGGEYGCLFSDNEFCPLQHDMPMNYDSSDHSHDTCLFHVWKPRSLSNSSHASAQFRKVARKDIANYCILLPKIKPVRGNEESLYTLFSSN